MTPQEFIRKWKPVALNERQTAQLHFKDLCLLFDHPDPIEDDPTGERFSFEKGAPKTGGGDGYADVWKNGYFAWEYKKRRRNLDEALVQLVRYAAALENPPLHVVCDTIHFKIITAWTNEVPAKYEFNIDDLAEPESLRILRAVFYDPEALRSKKTLGGANTTGRRQIFDDLGQPPGAQSGSRSGRAFCQSARLLFLRRQREAVARWSMEKAPNDLAEAAATIEGLFRQTLR